MNFLLLLLLLFQVVNCQEEPLFDCSSNYYRDEDSVCQLCDEDACKIVLQNKDTKYESCRGFCSSKADPKQYVTSTSTGHPRTTKQYFSHDFSFLATIVIIVFIVVLVIGAVIIMSIMIFYHQIKTETFKMNSTSDLNGKPLKIGKPLNPNSSTSNPLMAVRIIENDNGNETPLDSSCSNYSTKGLLMKTGKMYGEESDDSAETPLIKLRVPEIKWISMNALPSWMKTGKTYTEARPESHANAKIILIVNSTSENEKDNERTTESGYPNDSAKTPVIDGGQQPDENDEDNKTLLSN